MILSPVNPPERPNIPLISIHLISIVVKWLAGFQTATASLSTVGSFIKTPLKDYKDYFFSLLFRVLVFAVFTGGSVLHHSLFTCICENMTVKISILPQTANKDLMFCWNQQAIDMKMQIISVYHNAYFSPLFMRRNLNEAHKKSQLLRRSLRKTQEIHCNIWKGS